MKLKNILGVLAILTVFSFSGCTSSEKENNKSSASGSATAAASTTASTSATTTPISEKIDEEIEMTTQENTDIFYITVKGKTVTASFSDNAAVNELKEKLLQEDITIDADDYGGFEKVGSLGFSLTAEDTRTETECGDIMLYQSNQLTFFYGSNSWSYTPVGHIDMNENELKDFFGVGKVSIMLSMYNNSEINPEEYKNDASVIYFSVTNNTEGIAYSISEYLDADITEIEPLITYTAEDIDYNSDCRANREQNDDSARPEISNKIDVDSDLIYLGYPIWWGEEPRIIDTFLESYDLTGKTIIPFCTSGSSDISSSEARMKIIAPEADWMSGKRFEADESDAEIQKWVEEKQSEME